MRLVQLHISLYDVESVRVTALLISFRVRDLLLCRHASQEKTHND